mmetsp:Transcript_22720/g.42236  ORF Transcript_22720/g.42236 Transcript_22720/m.42236 type:complete len:157 (+) Transcript_22720:132-602(+)
MKVAASTTPILLLVLIVCTVLPSATLGFTLRTSSISTRATIRSSVVDRQQQSSSSSSSLNMSTNTAEIEVVSQPSKEFLEQKGVFGWGTWGCGVSKFPWTYDSNESCYLLKGKVTVTPSDGRKTVTFGAGDFVTFPAGMSCTWDVSEAVEKHFMFF